MRPESRRGGGTSFEPVMLRRPSSKIRGEPAPLRNRTRTKMRTRRKAMPSTRGKLNTPATKSPPRHRAEQGPPSMAMNPTIDERRRRPKGKRSNPVGGDDSWKMVPERASRAGQYKIRKHSSAGQVMLGAGRPRNARQQGAPR